MKENKTKIQLASTRELEKYATAYISGEMHVDGKPKKASDLTPGSFLYEIFKELKHRENKAGKKIKILAYIFFISMFLSLILEFMALIF